MKILSGFQLSILKVVVTSLPCIYSFYKSLNNDVEENFSRELERGISRDGSKFSSSSTLSNDNRKLYEIAEECIKRPQVQINVKKVCSSRVYYYYYVDYYYGIRFKSGYYYDDEVLDDDFYNRMKESIGEIYFFSDDDYYYEEVKEKRKRNHHKKYYHSKKVKGKNKRSKKKINKNNYSHHHHHQPGNRKRDLGSYSKYDDKYVKKGKGGKRKNHLLEKNKGKGKGMIYYDTDFDDHNYHHFGKKGKGKGKLHFNTNYYNNHYYHLGKKYRGGKRARWKRKSWGKRVSWFNYYYDCDNEEERLGRGRWKWGKRNSDKQRPQEYYNDDFYFFNHTDIDIDTYPNRGSDGASEIILTYLHDESEQTIDHDEEKEDDRRELERMNIMNSNFRI